MNSSQINTLEIFVLLLNDLSDWLLGQEEQRGKGAKTGGAISLCKKAKCLD